MILRNIHVCFPKAEIYRYVIEVSEDNERWNTVLNKLNTTIAEQEARISFKVQEAPVNARFIRIRFVDKSPAAIAEVEVSGIVRD